MGCAGEFCLYFNALFMPDSFSRRLIFGGDGIVTKLSHELTFAAGLIHPSL